MIEYENNFIYTEKSNLNIINQIKLNRHYNLRKNNNDKSTRENFFKNLIIFVLFLICIFELSIIIISRDIKRKFNSNEGNFYKKNLMESNINSIKEDFIQYYNKINKTIIHISMALNDNGIYPTLVSMTSALENNDKENNILKYYLLLSNNFDLKNVTVFESLKLKYQVMIN